MKIEQYTPALAAEWDETVEASRNGTFLHLRPYMDYHADRFTDCSLMARDDKNRIVAVLPANAEGDTVCSHRGLTFGGWLMTPQATAEVMMQIWPASLEYFASVGFRKLIYKPVPHIYHTYPAEEDLYALFRSGGNIESTLISSVIDMEHPLGFDRSAARYAKAAANAGVCAGESDRWEEYWDILSEVLAERHNAAPVHTIEEIKLLHSRFPANIRLFAAFIGEQMVAGTVMYISRTVAHCQYIAATREGRDAKVLPLLFSNVIEAMKGIRYFDFGTSNEDGGRILNTGLIHQKTGFGARATVYNTYGILL